MLFGNRIGKAGHHGIARTLNAFYIDRNRFRIPCSFRCDQQRTLFAKRNCAVGNVVLYEDLTIACAELLRYTGMNAEGGIVFFFVGFNQNRRCLHSVQKQRPRCVQNKGHVIFLCAFAKFIVEVVRKARWHTAAKDQHRCCGQNIFDSANNIHGSFGM